MVLIKLIKIIVKTAVIYLLTLLLK